MGTIRNKATALASSFMGKAKTFYLAHSWVPYIGGACAAIIIASVGWLAGVDVCIGSFVLGIVAAPIGFVTYILLREGQEVW